MTSLIAVSLQCEWPNVDIKYLISTEKLRKQGPYVTVKEMAFKMGQKSVEQKSKFLDPENPNSPSETKNVGHLIDLTYVPQEEKDLGRENVLKGARSKGSEEGIVFKNDSIH